MHCSCLLAMAGHSLSTLAQCYKVHVKALATKLQPAAGKEVCASSPCPWLGANLRSCAGHAPGIVLLQSSLLGYSQEQSSIIQFVADRHHSTMSSECVAVQCCKLAIGQTM